MKRPTALLNPARSRRTLTLLALTAFACLPASSATGSALASAPLTVVASGPLIGLDGQVVGQALIEQRGTSRYLHLKNAGGAAGATLELLLSPSLRPLRAGDHGGPGPLALRVGYLDRADLSLPLPASLRGRSVQTLWVWCASVRLPSARALLKWP
ncbi:hypothetical protein MF271_17920 (plasmid) [Deinococcus sp. KNUC1210]|uniref:hypothetical protein n=1 Tax=Deinococcus sp. KNUC1210 TaxID=2917691 RepID=UPI001EEF788A|nr:hypothetical protein [Deinococcus sp. KNUC1210]ULH17239.1 hypothetical protein MF271_17920 [Deinococcus sp. KNUC1210]